MAPDRPAALVTGSASGIGRAAALRLGVAAASATTAATGALPARQSATNLGWAVQRGDPGGTQYSPLAQIHAANVHRLEPAWVYHTGDATARSNSMRTSCIPAGSKDGEAAIPLALWPKSMRIAINVSSK